MKEPIETMRSVILLGIAIVLAGCHQGAVSAKPFTTIKPKVEDFAGDYIMVSRSDIPEGMAAQKGVACRIKITSDETFSIENFVNRDKVTVTTEGKWMLDTVGSDRGIDVWGLRLFSEPGIGTATFSGKTAPYRIVFIRGDPDSDNTIIFERE